MWCTFLQSHFSDQSVSNLSTNIKTCNNTRTFVPNPDSHAYQQNVTFTYDTILNATYVAAKYIQISKQIHMPPTFLEPSSEFEI